LRQAQAATRLTLERAVATSASHRAILPVLTMLKAYPGLSGGRSRPRGAADPQTVGVIVRNLDYQARSKKTPHPVHGRVLQWTLTRRGGALLAKCRRQSGRWSGG